MINPNTKEEIHVKCPSCKLTAFILKPLTDPPQPLTMGISHKCRKCGRVFSYPGDGLVENKTMIAE